METSAKGFGFNGRFDKAAHFRVPAMVCVNKFDLNPDQTRAIEALSREKGLTVLGRIPFDPMFTKSMVQGKIIFEYDDRSEVCEAVKSIWGEIITTLETTTKGGN